MGGSADYFFERYGSGEAVIEGALSANPGADAILGLYDIQYDTYTIARGTCGAPGSEDSVTWSIRAGVLQLSGSGAMADYPTEQEAPWYPYAADYESVSIDPGITNISERAFGDAVRMK